MILRKPGIAAILIFLVSCTATRPTAGDHLRLENKLKEHVSHLADDKLEGRRTGTAGERLAMEYIRAQFQESGLSPKGSDGYFQPFPVREGKQMAAGNYLIINGEELVPGQDYFAFPFSHNQTAEALPSISVREADMPWFIDLKEALESNPHLDVEAHVVGLVKDAKKKGASAVIFYNSSLIAEPLRFNPRDRTEKQEIPVLYLMPGPTMKYLSDAASTLKVKFRVQIADKERTGNNVIGWIDNGAPTTVIIGAHFDHLGYGEDGNSMVRNAQPAIHNGADDNASGTAALLELARLLKISKAKKNNYLFIAFSGEELGLYGSKYFTENPTIDIGQVNYMINLDMVGRLNDSTGRLTIGGIGTSPQWGKLLKTEGLTFQVRLDSSGTGPSDHTSFYLKQIPVLFFFTGLHSDYHRPSDDADKLNYSGTARIVTYIHDLILAADQEASRLSFVRTRETPTTSSARFSVSLGIMPDYTYSGTGVRADGVTDGRPGAKAGLKAGDIIIRLGDYSITSMEAYMQALGKFKKGDKTVVQFRRGDETLQAPVEF